MIAMIETGEEEDKALSDYGMCRRETSTGAQEDSGTHTTVSNRGRYRAEMGEG